MIFSQMVDDPSAHPDRFPTEKAQARERERLFGLIEKLVKLLEVAVRIPGRSSSRCSPTSGASTGLSRSPG